MEIKKPLAADLKLSIREINEYWPLIKPKLEAGAFCTQLGFYFNKGAK